MKLATRPRYAIRAMIVVAREASDGKPVNLSFVAERSAISKRYLEQVSISLKNAGLLKAVTGSKGGHLLAKAPQDIKLGEIIEATIGPINIVECVSNSENCLMSDTCECRSLYLLLNHRIKELFNSFTLADLIDHKVEAAWENELKAITI